MDHPNIIKLKDIVVGEKVDSVYLVFDYIPHDLAEVNKNNVSNFTVAEVKCILLQFFRAVDFLHQNFIVHRDLKLSNILYEKGAIKLCDFGLARYMGVPLVPLTPKVVTRWYRAPELFLGMKKYGMPIDNWACGCIMGELFTRKALFRSERDEEQMKKIYQLLGTPSDKIWPGYDKLPNAPKYANLKL